jgi:hypothetical protein
MAKKVSKRKTQTQNQTESGKSRSLLIGAAIVLGVVGLGYLLFLNLRGPVPLQDVVTFFQQPRGHDEEQTYTGTLPPAGGLHSQVWQNCGAYDEPIDAANAAHSLEHGAVWIAYQPDLPSDDVADLQKMIRGESHMLLSPYPNLESPVVLTGWGVQMELDSVDNGRISEFMDRYQRSRNAPEPGASCTDGVGTPLE